MKYSWIAKMTTTLMVVFFSASVLAQIQQPPRQSQEVPDVSDEELQVFVDASIKAQQIQSDSQREMIAIVEDEGLQVETYNEIMQEMQTGKSPEELDVSSSDMEKFENASELIGEIEVELEKKLISTIEDEGLELDRYQQIFTAIQTNPDLQDKLQQMVQEKQMQQGGQGQQPQGY